MVNIKKILRKIAPVKYYAIVILVLLGIYTWAELRGVRILGDDNQARETRRGQGAFYHK